MTTPLLGGEILAGHRFTTYDSRLVAHPALVNSAKFASIDRLPAHLARHRRGGGAELRSALRRAIETIGEPTTTRHDPTLAAARRAIFGIALAGLVLQILLYGVMRMPVAPQYFFGTFPIHVLLAWVAVDFLSRFRVAWLAILVYGAVRRLHHARQHRLHPSRRLRPHTYRPSLANQIEVARASSTATPTRPS